jgi:hypothetical protein
MKNLNVQVGRDKQQYALIFTLLERPAVRNGDHTQPDEFPIFSVVTQFIGLSLPEVFDLNRGVAQRSSLIGIDFRDRTKRID